MLKLLKYMKRKDVYLAFFCLFLSICQVACDISQPFLLTELSNSISTTDLGQIWTFAGGMIGLAVASFIIGSAITFVSARLAVRVGGNIRFELFNKVQNLTGAELDKLTTASLITRITNDVTFYQNTLVLVLRMLMRSTLIFIGGIIASFIYSSQLQSNAEFDNQSLWWLAFIIIGCLFVLMLIMSVLITFSIPFFGKQQKETDKTNAVMRENILGIKVVKAFNLQQEQIEVFDKQNKSLRYVSTRGQQIGMSLMPLIQFFVQISIVALLMVSAVMMEGSGAGQTEGTVLSFIQMVSLISMGMILSIIAIVNLAQTKACSNRILEVFNTQRSIPRNTSNNVIEDSSVEFKNVSFKYTNSKEALNVLENISFTAKPGEMIGIIGPTGSGKSTLVGLITRNYDVDSGEILISGLNIKDINYNSLRQSVGYSPQKSILFSGTIKSNLLFGKNDASEEELIEAAKKAEAYEFIKNKDGEFDAVVEQRGGNFSGGQKQRLSIARALIRKPKILILDDSTSALDMITEAKVQENIRSFKKSTVFLVGQRIAAISKADKIIVLDQGKMVGYGKHEELIKKCSLYKEIADSQAIGVEG
ncbi:MAG: ABC transporter ATP-binding protein/permease [Malacoplasma sp.]|nr:ABC transporter ATP-binding protein/permease [Malacoplasma sp.]MDE5952798.1 ABC transporter ATP-binding protein/permease [Malacoplasma sp.]MDE6894278.1 ABC transporter ATP-binding protein/permease [Malacoplasma sp.]MDE7088018.1 ABC transporter ATP-binding protein/permease [Malacoplasma sp.]